MTMRNNVIKKLEDWNPYLLTCPECNYILELLEKDKTFSERNKLYNSIFEDIKVDILASMESTVGEYTAKTPKRNLPSSKIERNSGKMQALRIIERHRSKLDEFD